MDATVGTRSKSASGVPKLMPSTGMRHSANELDGVDGASGLDACGVPRATDSSTFSLPVYTSPLSMECWTYTMSMRFIPTEPPLSCTVSADDTTKRWPSTMPAPVEIIARPLDCMVHLRSSKYSKTQCFSPTSAVFSRAMSSLVMWARPARPSIRCNVTCNPLYTAPPARARARRPSSRSCARLFPRARPRGRRYPSRAPPSACRHRT